MTNGQVEHTYVNLEEPVISKRRLFAEYRTEAGSDSFPAGGRKPSRDNET